MDSVTADILQDVVALKRPSMLVRAAKEGALGYRRKAHLRRYFGEHQQRCGADLLKKIMQLEAEQNVQRKAVQAEYSITQHVDILIALIGEAQILRASLSCMEP